MNLPPFLTRIVAPAVLGTALLFGLFWLLHALISHGSHEIKDTQTIPTVDFVRLNKTFEVETRERKPPPELPNKPEAPPEAMALSMDTQSPVANQVSIGPMNVENTTQVASSIGLSSTDGEYLPIVKVAPMYPARAQSRGQEGWVLVQFTVTEAGGVRDPVVVEAEPPGVFDDAAKKAVLKFKYKPRVESGKPIAVPNVQHLITFKIEK